jgi:hypothetical protein
MKMKKIISLLFALLLLLYPVSEKILAETEGNVGFSIQAVIPENQVDKEQSYFDLRMTPDQEQMIEVQIKNTSNETSQFIVNVNQAYTNSAGFIDYEDATVKKDKSLLYDISDIATYDSSVEVAANSSVSFPITLKMPSKSFDGQILAGIQVIKDTDSKSEGITNNYGYVLGLKLTESDVEVKRDLKLLSVKPAVSFSRTSVVATLQNPTMDAFGHLKYEAEVKNKATDEVEKKVTYDNNMQMAPNSTYGFAIDWDDKALVAGEYSLTLTVSDAKSNVWKFTEDFTITAKEADDVNALTVNRVADTGGVPLWAIIVIVILSLIIIGWFIFFLKRRKKEKDESEEKK